jgi:hypothetical protein
MSARTLQESMPVVDDGQISALSEQITHLRELIVAMVDLDRDTRRQSELLFRLLREFRAAKLARCAAQDMQARKVASLPGASCARCDA